MHEPYLPELEPGVKKIWVDEPIEGSQNGSYRRVPVYVDVEGLPSEQELEERLDD